MRIFVAIELSDALRRAAGEAACIIGASAGGRITRPENLHVTVRFLGECAPERADAARRAVERTARDTAPFALAAGPAGCFPRGRDSVAWLGLRGDTAALAEVYERLERELAREGFPGEGRRYSPHITLVRQVRAAALDGLRYEPSGDAAMLAGGLTLMQSARAEGRLAYLPRARAAFGAGLQAVVDRMEGQWAVCRTVEDGRERLLHRSLLPEGCREGDVLTVSDRGVAADAQETRRRKQAAERHLSRWKD